MDNHPFSGRWQFRGRIPRHHPISTVRRRPRMADDEASLFSPHSLLLTLQRWWKLIVPLGTVLAGVAAAILIWQFEPSYVAETIVKIEDQTPYIAFPDGDPEGNSKTFVATQIELMRSDVVLGPIAADDEIVENPRDRRGDRSPRVSPLRRAHPANR